MKKKTDDYIYEFPKNLIINFMDNSCNPSINILEYYVLEVIKIELEPNNPKLIIRTDRRWVVFVYKIIEAMYEYGHLKGVKSWVVIINGTKLKNIRDLVPYVQEKSLQGLFIEICPLTDFEIFFQMAGSTYIEIDGSYSGDKKK